MFDVFNVLKWATWYYDYFYLWYFKYIVMSTLLYFYISTIFNAGLESIYGIVLLPSLYLNTRWRELEQDGLIGRNPFSIPR